MKLAGLAVESLPFFEDERTPVKLTEIYEEGPERLRVSAVKAARHLEADLVSTLLQKALHDDDAWVRYYAIRSIDQLSDRAQYPSLMAMATDDPAGQVRLAAIEAIGSMKITEAAPIFNTLVKDENKDIVVAALHTLGDLEIPSTLSLIVNLLVNTNTRVSLEAIKALGHFQMDEVADHLYKIVVSYQQKEVKQAAIEALGNLRLERAVNHLLQLSVQKELNETCLKSLLKLKTFAIPLVEQSFLQAALPIKRGMIQFLTATRNPTGTQSLIKLLKTDDEEIRLMCLEALYNIGSLEATEIFEKLLHNDPSLRVRLRIKELLNKF
jgi:HEAT repeat protein